MEVHWYSKYLMHFSSKTKQVHSTAWFSYTAPSIFLKQWYSKKNRFLRRVYAISIPFKTGQQ